MEILSEDLLHIIREKCLSHWEQEIYKNHINVNLPDATEDCRSVYQQIKKDITKCV